ncbi:hypothetical protein LT493_37475 [Streptomyces tricolor]|nr:hypothetical protein [Streptomyces tricolor]
MLVSGHNISTTEVESALVSHPAVAEAAVVGAADETTGQAIVAFVIPARHGLGERRARRRTAQPRRRHARPDRQAQRILPVAELPKTRPARSCAGCCGTSPRTASSGTSPR